MKFLQFVACLLLSLICKTASSEVIVQLDHGSVLGEEMTGEIGNSFISFRGIPYAQPTNGNLRFQPPVPITPWNDTFNATRDGPSCPEGDLVTGEYMGDEDCLRLNVYTPKIPTEGSTLLDVVVNIHGGGFKTLNGSSFVFGPGRFRLDEALLVSINYRVSALGFLSTNDSASPGNYGLLDQAEALRWVKKNIHHFGGDPNKITILGQSAGSASVLFQMISPLTKGLFHRVVAMSGSFLSPWAVQKTPLFSAQKLAKDLNCPIDDSQELMNCLRSKTPQEIVEKSMLYPFTPVVDNFFIDDLPINLIQDKKYHQGVDLMIGNTKDEMDYFVLLLRKDPQADFTKEEIDGYLQMTVDQTPHNEKFIQRVWDKYLSNITSFKPDEVLKPLGKLLTDGMINMKVYLNVKMMSEDLNASVFFYEYDYFSPYANVFFFNTTENIGICHGNDLLMLFDGPWYRADPSDKQFMQMKDKYQNLIINFVKYGKPVPHRENDDVCEWKPVEPDTLYRYHINENCSVDVYDETKDELYKFWNEELFE